MLVCVRGRQSYRKFNDFLTKRSLVVLKEAPPYTPELEGPVLLNPLARASKDASGSYSFSKNPDHFHTTLPINSKTATLAASLVKKYERNGGVYGVGTDIETIKAVPRSEVFLERNFTPHELAYCHQAPDFQASLAGKWTAKEAVFKALKTESRGGGAEMKEIEILSSNGSAPQVVLRGEAKRIAETKGITGFELSITVRDQPMSGFFTYFMRWWAKFYSGLLFF